MSAGKLWNKKLIFLDLCHNREVAAEANIFIALHENKNVKINSTISHDK